jgi:predicted nucleotidyltransferase
VPGAPAFPSVVARVLERLTGELARSGLVEGLYLYGSLTTGDYSPARSDIDLVAVTVPAGLRQADLARLQAVHQEVAGPGGPAARLNCLYVRGGTLSDAERLHPYWYGDRFTQWQLKKMTVAELRHAGQPLHGPWPPPGLGLVRLEELQAAVRAELAGYWRDLAGQPDIWCEDAWVDFGLVTLARAAALLRDGDLVTKSQAIRRLGDFGVPADLADEIGRRRAGDDVTVSAAARPARAELARRIMLDGIRVLAGAD